MANKFNGLAYAPSASPNKARLVGADGILSVGVLGAEFAAPLVALPSPGLWKITKKHATASGWDAGVKDYDGSTTRKYNVGDFIWVKAGADVTLAATGDGGMPVTLSPLADISEWSLNFSADEIAVTTLVDAVKKYRTGKTDADGSVKGIMTLGETTLAKGILNRFLKIIHRVGAANTVISDVDTNPLFIQAVLQNDQSANNWYTFMLCQANLFGCGIGGGMGNAQEFSSKFRLTGMDPVLIEQEY